MNERSVILTINGIIIDFGNGTLRDQSGQSISLRPQSFAVLRYLAENANRLVTKDELIQAVWPGIAVTDDSIVQCIHDIRRALLDEDQFVLKTVPKHGYQLALPAMLVSRPNRLFVRAAASTVLLLLLVGAISVWWLLQHSDTSKSSAERTPIVAVLPFDDISAEKNLGHIGDGVAEDIIFMLARSPDVAVIARNSSFAYRGEPLDVRKIGAELGADYILEGSVRKEADKLRLVAQLEDAKTGRHLWAERFDEATNNPWSLYDTITGRIVASLTGDKGEIKQAQYPAVWLKDSTALDEYDYYLRGLDIFVKARSEAAFDRSSAIWEEGLKKFPDSALLRIKLGWNYQTVAFRGYSKNPNEDFAQAGRLVREAMAQNNLSPMELRTGHWLLAYVLCRERDFKGALQEAATAISMAPNDASMFGDLSKVYIMAGEPMQAVELINKAQSLDPRNINKLNIFKGWALQVAGKPAESVAAYENSSLSSPMALLTMAISFARIGRDDEARKLMKKALAIEPAITQTRWRDRSLLRQRHYHRRRDRRSLQDRTTRKVTATP